MSDRISVAGPFCRVCGREFVPGNQEAMLCGDCDAMYEKIWPVFDEAVRSGVPPEVIVAVFERVARAVRERLTLRVE